MLLKVREAADAAGIGVTKMREVISRGEIEVVRIDGAVRVPVAALRAYVDRLSSPVGGATG